MNATTLYTAVVSSTTPLPLGVQKAVLAWATRSASLSEDVLVLLARRRDLDPEIDAALGKTRSLKVFTAWVQRPGRTLEEKQAIVTEEKRVSVLAALAADSSLPGEVLDTLIPRMSVRIAQAASKNRAASDALLRAALAVLDSDSIHPLPAPAQENVLARPHLLDSLAATTKSSLGRTLLQGELSSASLERVVSVLLDRAARTQKHLTAKSEEFLASGRGQSIWYRSVPPEEVREQEALSELLGEVTSQVPHLSAKAAKAVAPSGNFAAADRSASHRWRDLFDTLRAAESGAPLPGTAKHLADASSEDPDLTTLLRWVSDKDHNGTRHEKKVAREILGALAGNLSVTGEDLTRVAHATDGYSECANSEAMKARWELLRPEDEDAAVEVYRRCGSYTIFALAKSSERLARRLLDEVSQTRPGPRRQRSIGDAAELLSTPLGRKWLLEQPDDVLTDVLACDRRMAALVVEEIISSLGDTPEHWEVFEALLTTSVSMQERIEAAKAL